MAKKRIKVAAPYKDFLRQIRSLKKFDQSNQSSFQKKTLSKKQLHLLTESIFFAAFREYENLIRDLFILYTQEKKKRNGEKVFSYLQPVDFFHAENLIKSSMEVLDWNSPDNIIKRSELYLKDGYPIKEPYAAKRTFLLKFKKLRNHIAHNSLKSLREYKKILKDYYGTEPIKIPNAGEFLLYSSKIDPSQYQLLEFFDNVEDLAERLT